MLEEVNSEEARYVTDMHLDMYTGMFCVFIVYKSQSIVLKVQNRIRSNRTGCHKYEGVLQISKYKRDNWSYEYIKVKRGYGPQGTINVNPIQAWCSRRYRHCPKRTINDKSKCLQIAMVSRTSRTRNHALKETLRSLTKCHHGMENKNYSECAMFAVGVTNRPPTTLEHRARLTKGCTQALDSNTQSQGTCKRSI